MKEEKKEKEKEFDLKIFNFLQFNNISMKIKKKNKFWVKIPY